MQAKKASPPPPTGVSREASAQGPSEAPPEDLARGAAGGKRPNVVRYIFVFFTRKK